MKKFAISLTALLTAFTLTTKAQHGGNAGHEPTKNPPKILFNKQLPTNLPKEQVEVAYVVYAPGEISKPHRHPMAVVGYVLEGDIEVTFEGVKKTYHQGDVFWEEPGGLHNQTRNLSNTKAVKLAVFLVGAKGSPLLVPEKSK
ncbi:cupin domain-containing protein [Paraflavitalea pollutisoli]|uniref:cupin domain-containing protein n=1 Tax=Paraflavitalea pollutisoli TaxID=3034143 RepID=UPI0023ECCDB9|nr:cupin domain-containing protein [Paraflavitalea sp. H1-2-19X]